MMENLLYLLGTGTEVCLAVGFLCTFCRGEWESGTAFQLYCIAAFAVMSAFGLVLLCRKRMKDEFKLPLRYWAMLISIPLCSVLTLTVLICRTESDPVLVVLICMILLAANFSAFRLYEYFSDYSTVQGQLQNAKAQINEFTAQLESDKKAKQQVSNLRHDLKNHIEVLRFHLREGNTDEALKYLNSMSKELHAQEVSVISGNPAVDGILRLKYDEAIKNGIDFTYDILIPAENIIDAYDLCTILFNLLDNAIEAQQKVKESPFIRVVMKTKADLLEIRVLNSCDANLSVTEGILPKTAKSGKSAHGFGLGSVQNAAQKYRGVCSFTAADGIFTSRVILCIGRDKNDT